MRIKKVLFAVALIGFAGCQAPPVIEYAGGDGSSKANAIVIKGAKNERAGIAAEQSWLRDKFPGFALRSQAELSASSKRWDEIQFTTADGKDRVVYFDITEFFGN